MMDNANTEALAQEAEARLIGGDSTAATAFLEEHVWGSLGSNEPECATSDEYDDPSARRVRYGNNKAHRSKATRKTQARLVKRSQRRNRQR